jgi:GT2 family glycosyltransferase
MTESLSIVIVGYNRPSALARTIRSLREDATTTRARVVVAVNAGGAVADVPDCCAGADEILRMEANIGVDAYNRGVERVSTPFTLILDDDARPAPGVVAAAIQALECDAGTAAVALHPLAGPDLRSEWPFARASDTGRTDWPLLGCGHILRTEDWRRVGGYESAYFLYGNDTDLALKLLGGGRGVLFRPEWVVWHDTCTAFARPDAWFRLATRNRVWTARRHAGAWWPLAAALACADSHRRAGLRLAAHWLAHRGAWAGFARTAPPHVATAGSRRAYRTLLSLSARLFRRGE